ncbi:hypothetical protein AB0Q93_14080, partial [Streptomyces sp. NPDC088184]
FAISWPTTTTMTAMMNIAVPMTLICIAVEHAAATALAALTAPDPAYRPGAGERIAVVLCGANTDPGDLVRPAAGS